MKLRNIVLIVVGLLAITFWSLGFREKLRGKSDTAKGTSAPYSHVQMHGTFPVPHAVGEHPNPIWFDHPYWDQYEMGDGFWQCPVGYVQYQGDGDAMGPSKNGELSGGSEDHAKMPHCRLPHKGEFDFVSGDANATGNGSSAVTGNGNTINYSGSTSGSAGPK